MSQNLGFRNPASGEKFKELLQQEDNLFCADCGAPDPKWASVNIGVFICLKCCDEHRRLGLLISKVLSVTLDEWTENEVQNMIEVGGNHYANIIYEYQIPEGVEKPSPDSNPEQRLRFIRSKYELQEFLKPKLRIAKSNRLCHRSSFSLKILDSFRIRNSSEILEEVAESIGWLTVTVKNGTDLAIRDIKSSDPYVVLTLGNQTVRTAVIKNNLNPIWNEKLMLPVPLNYGPVKVKVYDHDTFSADDIMGEAEVDIQPLITSAMAIGDPALSGDMQIGKWLKSHDNALAEDSTINVVDGKVEEEVSLLLQKVESGILQLQLQWCPSH